MQKYKLTNVEYLINQLENLKKYGSIPCGYFRTIENVVSLLRTHPDAQPNEPLTEEEIKKMVGEPVYYPQGPEGKRWLIVDYIAITAVIGGAKLYRRPPSQD